MTCPERPLLIPFLTGELSADDTRGLDQHLLRCESCWREVQADRAGRLALERLRDPAPLGLEDRVRLAVGLAEQVATQPGRKSLGARRRRLVALAAGIVIAATTGGLIANALGSGPASDPPQIARVVAMVTSTTSPSALLRSGERMEIAGQQVLVRAYMVDGIETLAATSMHPFPMPVASHLLSGSSRRAWMATRGSLSLYGVNKSGGARSMFVVAAMPAAELPEVAAHLHLI